jgi:hypothetical protein
MGEAQIRQPLMSGHCSSMGRVSENGIAAHERCQRNGGGQRANPQRIFQPCPCACHFPAPEDVELFECSECGGLIIEAPNWPLDDHGDMRYTHVDWIVNDDGVIVGGTGRALGEECGTKAPVSGNTATTKDCARCGDDFTPVGRERICPECKASEVVEVVDEFEALMNAFDDEEGEDDDEFADLDDLDFEDV